MHKKTFIIVGSVLLLNLVLGGLTYDCIYEKLNDNPFIIKIAYWIFKALLAWFCIFLFWKIRNRKPWEGKGIVVSSLIVALFFGPETVELISRLPHFPKSASHSSLCNKIVPSDSFLHEMRANELSYLEYLELGKYQQLPSIKPNANHINYLYRYDGFLRDYSLEVDYHLPISENIESFEKSRGAVIIHQSVEKKTDYNLVVYSEYRD